MSNNTNFVAYEYKNITVKRDYATIYTDCLSNFGWTLVDEYEYGFQPILSLLPTYTSINPVDEQDVVSLKFKRDRRINSKQEVNRLERECEEALSSIGSIERKNNAFTMGISLGAGIVGTAVLGFAAYSFLSANIVIGVALSVIGFAGWGIGFFANRRMGRKKATQTESLIQERLDVAYGACEQAYAMLA